MVAAAGDSARLAYSRLAANRCHDGAQRIEQGSVLVVVGVAAERQHVLDYLGKILFERSNRLGARNLTFR